MNKPKFGHISISKPAFIGSLAVAAVSGGLLAFFLSGKPQSPENIPLQIVPEAAVVIKKPTASKKPSTAKKPASKPSPTTNKPDHFVIKGLISTAGEPWSRQLIRVKLLWLKSKDQQQFLLGHENALIQMTKQGLAYQLELKPQPGRFINFNGGVEGNIARVIAYVDQQGDGNLTPGKDKIIAVSKEVLRYRTGRFNQTLLNDIQQKNILAAGKGYVFIRNEPTANGQMDWRVVADQSPVRLDLNAAEASLPAMYNTFLKLL